MSLNNSYNLCVAYDSTTSEFQFTNIGVDIPKIRCACTTFFILSKQHILKIKYDSADVEAL